MSGGGQRPVLLIGGMDSSGGAGLLRDAAAASGAGVPYRVAVTAVTAQTDGAVTAIHPVPTEVVAAQIAAAGPVGAVKIGMLHGRRIVAAVAGALPPAPVVLDPVIRASSGRALLDREGLSALLELLLPRAALLTPNLPELRLLGDALGCPPGAEDEAIAGRLFARGCAAVLVKGGHGGDPRWATDRLFTPAAPPRRYRARRAPVELRGTGCQLASAIAASLAAGVSLDRAVRDARAGLNARFAEAAKRRPEGALPPAGPAGERRCGDGQLADHSAMRQSRVPGP